MREDRHSWSPLLVVAGLAVIGICLVMSTTGCSRLNFETGIGPSLEEAGASLPEVRARELEQQRRDEIERLLEERIPLVVEQASKLAAERTGTAVGARLDEWFEDASIEDVDLQETIRDAVESKLPKLVQLEAEIAAKRVTDPVVADLQAEHAKLEKIDANLQDLEKTLLERIGEGAKAAAGPASMIPGYGTSIATGLGILGSIITWFVARRRKPAEILGHQIERRDVPT